MNFRKYLSDAREQMSEDAMSDFNKKQDQKMLAKRFDEFKLNLFAIPGFKPVSKELNRDQICVVYDCANPPRGVTPFEQCEAVKNKGHKLLNICPRAGMNKSATSQYEVTFKYIP